MPPKQYQPFNHEDLVNFKISKPQHVDDIQKQMIVAENNFTAILQAALKISNIFSKFERVTTFNLEGITNLVQDLRTVLRLLRSRLYREFPGISRHGQPAAPGDQIPERFRNDVYTCLCPLTVLLQAVAQCLSDLKVAAPSHAGNNAWGTIEPLQKLLVNMERSLSTTEAAPKQPEGEHTGLAFCIMLHERNSRYLVTSTAPQYGALKGLKDYGSRVRRRYMNRMKEALSDEALLRVQSLETYSESVKQERTVSLRVNKTWTGAPSATLAAPEAIMGHNGAFRTTGDYMTACLLDHLRFQIGKTANAADIENRMIAAKRGVAGSTSCAEWELYITLLHSPDPQAPHAPQFVAVTYGMPKSKTWETNKFNSRPAPTTHQAPRPTPLPSMPKPT